MKQSIVQEKARQARQRHRQNKQEQRLRRATARALRVIHNEQMLRRFLSLVTDTFTQQACGNSGD